MVESRRSIGAGEIYINKTRLLRIYNLECVRDGGKDGASWLALVHGAVAVDIADA
jgi:hypothetical protein